MHMRVGAIGLAVLLFVLRAYADEPYPSRMSLGEHGFIEIHALLQGWYIAAFDDNDPYGKVGTARNSFRIRRTEIKLSGNVIENVSFGVMLDPAKSASKKSLQDLVLTFSYVPNAEFSIGQAKTPVSLEGLTSSSKLLFVERALSTKAMADRRDMGAWVHHRFDRFAYQLGVYNGAGANTLDTDKRKDVAARVEVIPADGLHVAGSLERTMTTNSVAGRRTTLGGDVQYTTDDFVVQGEFYQQELYPTTRMGAYAAAAYTLRGFSVPLQPAVRWEWYDPDTDADNDASQVVTVGLNVLLGGPKTKLQLNYAHLEAQQSGKNSNVVLLAAQVAF